MTYPINKAAVIKIILLEHPIDNRLYLTVLGIKPYVIDYRRHHILNRHARAAGQEGLF